MKQTVAPWRSIAASRFSGPACSSSTDAAPTRIGKVTRPPSPNVKAIGGEPMKTSSAFGRSTSREKVSQIASTSRWKCIVPFGRPEVPLV